MKAADLAWDPKRQRIYASVPSNAAGTNADQVIAIDPVSGRITGSVWTGQDPGRIALTSGGEYLYVVLNGNGRIARIDPSTLSVTSTFAVGTSSTYGVLYAEDISAVAGQPDLLVVAQQRKSAFPRHHGVAVYEAGVARPNQTGDTAISNAIEPSADPAVFFGYNNETSELGFRRLRLDASGMSEIDAKTNLIGDYNADIRSDGNTVFSTSGVVLEGASMVRLGAFSARGPVCPDLAANRVYFAEYSDSGFQPPSYGIVAYDPATFAEINQLALPDLATLPSQLIRWGTNGLAACSGTDILVISSSRLVPSDAPANLAVTVTASPVPAWESAPLTYSVALTNQGPQTARHPIIEVTLSDGQALQSVGTTSGTTGVSNNTVRVYLADMPAGAVAALNLTTVPESAGPLACSAIATSRAVDPDFADNATVKIVGAGFQSALNTVHHVRLTANNLIYDPTRNLLWASIPAEISPPLAGSVVSIDPTSGVFSDPIRIGGNPAPQCMALTANGRYLYLGLSDSPEVLRLDLASGSSGLRIPLGTNLWGWMDHAEDIEPLEGDGTSFLVVTQGDGAVAVFDGTVPRTNRSALYTADRIERTDAPDIFVGYAGPTGNYKLTRLAVTGEGVSISQSVDNYAREAWEIRGAGNLVLFSSGVLADSSNLALIANLGFNGSPCLDLSNHRAYLVFGNSLRGFDTTTTMATGTFPLPVWAQSCVRWGPDGFALLGYDREIYIARWSEANPAGPDTNGDGFSDSWETTYFGGLTVDPGEDNDGDGLRNFQEYVFATSPLEPSSDPVLVSSAIVDGQLALRLVFPRRAGLVPRPYDYVISSDLERWAAEPNVSETVLSVQTVGGIQVETVEALIPAANPEYAFIRFRWNPH